jgi:hypothetical protein
MWSIMENNLEVVSKDADYGSENQSQFRKPIFMISKFFSAELFILIKPLWTKNAFLFFWGLFCS